MIQIDVTVAYKVTTFIQCSALYSKPVVFKVQTKKTAILFS